MIELELKAVVSDPAACRARLLEAGATPGFCGLMEDRRFDRAGELLGRDQVLRVRRYRGDDAPPLRLAWKGPARVSGGYKEREEVELQVAGGAPEALLEALGYQITESIDRQVEYYTVPGGAAVRLEWYPRMDVLVEVEGTPEAIERAIELLAIDRFLFTAESLAAFVTRYQIRTGRLAAISVAALGGEPAAWAPS